MQPSNEELDLSLAFDTWDAPHEPKAAERNLIRAAWVVWRCKTMPLNWRKQMAQSLLNAARANRAAGGNTKKSQAAVHRALHLCPNEGRQSGNIAKEYEIWRTASQLMFDSGLSRDGALRQILASNHPVLVGYPGRSIENLRRVYKKIEEGRVAN